MHRIVPRILLFDRFVLDLRRGCLRAGDQDVELRPKPFEVLCYLVENAGHLVGQEELREAVWGEVIVSSDSIFQCIRELRSKLGDDEHRLIKTVARRGYLLDAAVSEQEAQLSPSDPPAMPFGRPQVAPGGSRPPWTVPKRGVLLAIVAVLLVAGVWWTIHQVGWPIDRASPGHGVLAPNIVGGAASHAVFKDCPDCPEMVVLPAGEFMMGSPASEPGRQDAEGLPRRVVIPKRFAIGKFKVTVDEFSRFVAETRMPVGDHCRVLVELDHDEPIWSTAEASFRHPGFETAGSHPVVCVNWYEAQAYATWLERRTGRPYRLLTESEWEYAARAGTNTRYSFGDDEGKLCAYARFADLASAFMWRDACRSKTVAFGTVPVGSLQPNPWGLFDMHGNAWEWVQDCWTRDVSKMPNNGTAFTRGRGCEEAVIRGGSFAAPSRRLRSATRVPAPPVIRTFNDSFRVGLSLGD